MAKRIKLTEYRTERRAENAIEIEADDGEVFVIDPPELWPDEALRLAQADDNFGLARILIGGDDAYARFVAAGGTATMLGKIFQEFTGASLPQSGASSSS